jgi:D-xylose transport system ATP-binding protein
MSSASDQEMVSLSSYRDVVGSRTLVVEKPQDLDPPPFAGRSLSKSFGHVQALDSVSFDLRAGEVLALLGDNGAGKSTLVKIASGVVHPDAGELLIDGQPVSIDTPRKARSLGIASVFQDLALVNQRDVASNLFLGVEPRRHGFILDRKRMVRESEQLIRGLRVGLPSVRALVEELSGGQRQAIAIARAVMRGGRVVIMDEPTAALGVRESRRVLDLIAELRAEGHSVLLVSHNMENVLELADRALVLRLGRRVAEVDIRDTSHEELVGHIVGGRIDDGR